MRSRSYSAAPGVLVASLALAMLVAPTGCAADAEADNNEVGVSSLAAIKAPAYCPLSPSERGYVKWNPGHYVIPVGAETQQISNFVSEYKDIAAVRGVQRTYFWSRLESAWGRYDWRAIDDDIAKVSAVGKKLALVVGYKYQISDTESSLPKYILNLPNADVVPGVLVPSYFEQGKANDGAYNDGQHANFGHPGTRNRFKALLKEISERYDANPNVASLSFIETSTGAVLSDAQDTLFLDGIIDMQKYAGCMFKHTPLFQNLNFPRGRLMDFVDNMKVHGVGLGGPDVFFDSLKLADNALGYRMAGKPKGVYHYYPDVAGTLPIGQQVHAENFRYATREEMLPPPGTPHNYAPSDSVTKVFDFAKAQLRPNYMFWQAGGASDPYGLVLKARLKANGMPLITTCPSLYGGTCK